MASFIKNNYKIIYEGRRTQISFYMSNLNLKHTNITYTERHKIKLGDKILIHSSQVKAYIKSHYKIVLLETFQDIEAVHILAHKTIIASTN